MNKELHPSFYDIVPSVAGVITRRFRNWVSREDIIQECWVWAVAKNNAFKEMLDEPNEQKRIHNERKVAWQMRRAAERFARKEKAAKAGYETNDESYYNTTIIAQLLPFAIHSYINSTALQQAQDMVNDGLPKKQSVPAESGNLIAMLIDIKKAYEKLDVDDQKILERREYDKWTLNQIAQYLECSVSTADRKCSTALKNLQDLLGGDTPWS